MPANQWRGQGHSFGGGGQNASAEGASHPRGVGGHAPPGNFEIYRKFDFRDEYRKCDFLHFAGEIWQKKVLLLRITHSHRPPPQFLLGFHLFTGVVLQVIGGKAEPPLVNATAAIESKLIYCCYLKELDIS